MPAAAIILAAGLGTRMRSAIPKALHKLAGRPMLSHLIASCEEVFDRIVVVVGPGMPALEKAARPHATVVQAERLGTGHAALQAEALLGDFAGDAAVLYADNPLIPPATIRRLLDRRAEAGLALLAMRPADPGRYGRVVLNADGDVARVVEWADATEAERGIALCNAGVVCAPAPALFRWLRHVRPHNAKEEYYLTDIIGLAVAEGQRVVAEEAAEADLAGVNSRAELAALEAKVQQRLREQAMAGGATLVAPETVFLAWDTRLGQDVTVGPNVVFGPGVTVEDGAEIRAFSHLEGCVVRQGAIIGPFARLRPGTEVGVAAHVGNFVELKAALLGDGAKANHLSYLGDATIGPGSNIGAGTITCNYDGVNKHRTEIGAAAFIGSDTALVAPVKVGDRALVAAGSVITEDVPADAMAIARGRQAVKPGRGFRGKQAAERRGAAPAPNGPGPVHGKES
ncbi:bifunctional UDP-N-acetylglucosamine diphosphorylase/glucosamine-1-phosphate N-acetyltransferase GlmU [Siccirubricoccus sp. KC 17139]|uniref:Bifunctional protein GlmU n=1 Tax=Siccirubricoccus soli TaxID=2899147 RepID=A0ABT1D4Q8_9PROT|nr:bifunctional UDP-N-acetylglucosamine diphosphorylase/glucosamine-1-phosphate N-acetyltransferase GlmU [Siccirubricoccus soli]MCO6416612.1 bifunctional UDP-N-acetylglucosamine diphosphorylase/glucosamine-1-phosphate N-acetyltransferase GlmU [Siccirubricoccus soli]MCP2682747.1 bifunctional UDP-N-acetylglucosamine diphosphorylase/glucosamine-1-phosphate N-acetyltransferase GlmU [Siccirubricoccus soli]